MQNKGFSPILVLLFLVLVSGLTLVGYAHLGREARIPEHTEEKVDTKTYVNKKYDFRFEYPSDWYLTDCEILGITALNNTEPPGCEGDPEAILHYPITISTEEVDRSPEAYIEGWRRLGFKVLREDFFKGISDAGSFVVKDTTGNFYPGQIMLILFPVQSELLIFRVTGEEYQEAGLRMASTMELQ